MKKHILLILALCLFVPTTLAFAKGDFDYITVDGPGLTDKLNITNPLLTHDFFVFADFSKGAIAPPVDPGEGYEIVRVYIVDTKAHPFDQLYYYPYTGYVFYYGLAEGSSEYDGQWYIANPSANDPFRASLAERARLDWIPLGVLFLILAGFFIAYRTKPKRT